MSVKAENGVSFFEDNNINYWEGENNGEGIVKKEKSKKVVQNKKKDKFLWNEYLDVENDNFFREGKHLPPAPLMEVARRPTDNNIKNYLKYFGMKNLIKARMQNAIESYIKRNKTYDGKILPYESKKYLLDKVKSFKKHVSGRENIVFTMFFRSTCPHCKRMFKTLENLGQMGFIVKAVQTDRLPYQERFNVPISSATKEDMNYLKRMGVKGVPFTLVQVKDGEQYSLKGYRSTREVVSLLKTQLKVDRI